MIIWEEVAASKRNMANRVGTLRRRLFSGDQSAPKADAMIDAVESHLESDEFVHRHLLGKTQYINIEKDGETERLTVDGPAGTLVVLTDRKLLFAVVSAKETLVRGVSYIDIKDVGVDDGLLRSTLTVEVWPSGRYQLKIQDSTRLSAAVSSLVPLSDCWQFAVSQLESASEKIPAVGEAIEKGELGEVRAKRTAVENHLTRAYDRIEQTTDELDIQGLPALTARTKSSAIELHRTEMHARVARASTLMSQAEQRVESRDYTTAAKQFWKARDHLENAQMLARRASIDEPSVIESRLKQVENSIESVRVQPLAQAKQTLERADNTERQDVRVETLQEAFEHYRDALTAGWGADFEFAGDRESLRTDIQEVICELTTARCEYALSLASRAATHQNAGREEKAENARVRANEQLTAANQLAAEFRAADTERVEETAREIEALLSKENTCLKFGER